jgi:hypothetical protein
MDGGNFSGERLHPVRIGHVRYVLTDLDLPIRQSLGGLLDCFGVDVDECKVAALRREFGGESGDSVSFAPVQRSSSETQSRAFSPVYI